MKKFILTTTAVLALSAGMASAAVINNPDRPAGDANDAVGTQYQVVDHRFDNLRSVPITIDGVADISGLETLSPTNPPRAGFFKRPSEDNTYYYYSTSTRYNDVVTEAQSQLNYFYNNLPTSTPTPVVAPDPAPAADASTPWRAPFGQDGARVRNIQTTGAAPFTVGESVEIQGITHFVTIITQIVNVPGAAVYTVEAEPAPLLIGAELDAAVAVAFDHFDPTTRAEAQAITREQIESQIASDNPGIRQNSNADILASMNTWIDANLPEIATPPAPTYSDSISDIPVEVVSRRGTPVPAAETVRHVSVDTWYTRTRTRVWSDGRDDEVTVLPATPGTILVPNPGYRAPELRTFNGIVHSTVALRDAAEQDYLNTRVTVDADDVVITLLSGTLSESFTQTWVQVQDQRTPPTLHGPATQSNVEAQRAAQADLDRRANAAAPDVAGDWSQWTEISRSEPVAVAEHIQFVSIDVVFERTRTVEVRGDDDGLNRRETTTRSVSATNPAYTLAQEAEAERLEAERIAAEEQAARDAERNLAEAVVHQDWTEVNRVVIEESRVEGEVVLGTAKTKYVNQTRVDTVTAEATRITEERIMRIVVTDGDGDHVRNDDTTETRTRTEGGRVYQQTVNLGSIINPAYLAAKRALEKEIHDGFESGEKLKGTFGPHDVEVTVNLDIGGVQAAKKFETTHSNLSHDLSAHATPRVGLFGIGKGNYIGYHAGVELGASVQKQGSDAKVTVGYDSGDHFHVQGSHNGFSGAGGNGQTDDALFAEASAPVDDFTTAKVRVDSEGRESVTLQDERGYSLGLARGTDGHTSITAGYKLKF